jgi:hypothetical protein
MAQPITLVHPMCLLEAPAIDERALELLVPGDYPPSGEMIRGFVPIQTADGRRGYVPAAACAPHASQMRGGEPPAVGVIQDVALYQAPAPGAQFAARWIIQPEEALLVLRREGKFIHIRRPDGQTGYVPQVLCREPPAGYHGPPTVRLVQPVSLYGEPRPGSQL